jgi:hypothetical protein
MTKNRILAAKIATASVIASQMFALPSSATTDFSTITISATYSVTGLGNAKFDFTVTDGSSRLQVVSLPGGSRTTTSATVGNIALKNEPYLALCPTSRSNTVNDCFAGPGNISVATSAGTNLPSFNGDITYINGELNGDPITTTAVSYPYVYLVVDLVDENSVQERFLVPVSGLGGGGSSDEPAPAVSYGGPLVTGFDNRFVAAGSSSVLTLTGKRLSKVTGVTIGGETAVILSQSRGQLVLHLPSLSVGTYDIVLNSTAGRVTIIGLVQVD